MAKLHQQQVLFASAATASSAAHLLEPGTDEAQPNRLEQGALKPADGATSIAANAELAQDAEDSQQLISMDEFGLADDANNENGDLDQDDQDEHQGDKHTASQYSRRRSRAVLYQLSGHFNERRSVNMKTKLKLNNVSTIYLLLASGFCLSYFGPEISTRVRAKLRVRVQVRHAQCRKWARRQ